MVDGSLTMESNSKLNNNDFFAGFAAGDGYFSLEKSTSGTSFAFRFCIVLRADDGDILKRLQEVFGGTIRYHTPSDKTLTRIPGANPTCKWSVARQNDILNLILYFDEHILYTKKAIEYRLWRKAALLYFNAGNKRGPPGNTNWLIEKMDDYKIKLSQLKQYNTNAISI